MRFKIKLLFVLILLLCNLSSCIKLNQCSKFWKFELPFNIENQQDTYRLSDTIWVVSEFNSSLHDLNSGDFVNVGDFDFKVNITLGEIHGTPISFANDQFEVVKQNGSLTYIGLNNSSPDIAGNAGYHRVKHNFQSNLNSFKYGFIPKKEGVFLLSLLSIFESEFDDIDFGTECLEEIDRIIFKMNNNQNNNFDLLSLSPDSRIVEITEEDFIAGGMFAFTVVP